MVPRLVIFKDTTKKTRGAGLSDDEFDAIAVGITHLAQSHLR